MALPLYLALTASEMSAAAEVPRNAAWMSCHFSPGTLGISNIPTSLPEGSILILDDRFPCQGHSPDLAAGQLAEAAGELRCGNVLLDFQRPPEPESLAMVRSLLAVLPCPAAVSPEYARESGCAVFLPPCPLSCPLEDRLAPWAGREVWLEAALCQEIVTVTEGGTERVPQFPPEGLTEGFYSEELCCRYRTQVDRDRITFTLFDTPDSLKKKLEKARSLGITRAVGLYQELGPHLSDPRLLLEEKLSPKVTDEV